MTQTRVAVVDTDRDAQRTLLASLAADPGLNVVSATVVDARSAHADVLVLGSRGDAQQGARLCAEVTRARPDLPVILIVDTDRAVEVLTALAAGAGGVVLRADDADAARTGARHVAMGRNFVDPALAHTVVQLAVGDQLDPTDLPPRRDGDTRTAGQRHEWCRHDHG